MVDGYPPAPQRKEPPSAAGRAGRGCAAGPLLLHRRLEVLVDRGEELLRGLERLLGTDEQRQVLRHSAALDRLDADALQRLRELGDGRRAVHTAARAEAARPREDRRDRVGRGRVALLVLAVVARDGAVRGL